jgi:hypothetical protein
MFRIDAPQRRDIPVRILKNVAKLIGGHRQRAMVVRPSSSRARV